MPSESLRLHQFDERPHLDLQAVPLGPPPEVLLTRFRMSGECVLAFTLLWSALGGRPGKLERQRASDMAGRFRKDPAAGRSWLKTLEALGLIHVTKLHAGEQIIHVHDPDAAYLEYCQRRGLMHVPADPQREIAFERSEDVAEEAPTSGGCRAETSDRRRKLRESEDVAEDPPTPPEAAPKIETRSEEEFAKELSRRREQLARETLRERGRSARAPSQDPELTLHKDPCPKVPDSDPVSDPVPVPSPGFAAALDQAANAPRAPFARAETEHRQAEDLHQAVGDPSLSIEFCEKVLRASHATNADGQSKLPFAEIVRILRKGRRKQQRGELREGGLAPYFTVAVMNRYRELNGEPWPRSRHPP